MTHFWTNTKVDYGNESIWMVHFWTITKTSGDYGDCTLVDQYKNECLKFKNISILGLNAYFSQIVENCEFLSWFLLSVTNRRSRVKFEKYLPIRYDLFLNGSWFIFLINLEIFSGLKIFLRVKNSSYG